MEGKIVHKLTGDLLDSSNGSQGAKWIFVMSTYKKLYAGEVRDSGDLFRSISYFVFSRKLTSL